jgi:hypothetical protein
VSDFAFPMLERSIACVRSPQAGEGEIMVCQPVSHLKKKKSRKKNPREVIVW